MIKAKRISLLILFIVVLCTSWIRAQQPEIMNAAETQIALKKLLTLGSVLYIGAHPDDENTACLAFLSREKMLRAGYLSLTRGDGGQNLIGSEKGELMGLIRTHELLAARKFDRAEQFFTRAIDFGFSKTSAESIAIWGNDNIVEDIVFVIRKFQPDIIISRFGTQEGGSGHGHHTASAILALEAFKAAGDPSRFPEQLKYVSVWKPKRIFWNTWLPYQDGAKPEEIKKLIAVDVGTYNPLLGKSYHEIASLSRSMHKSQGFGAVPVRGQRLDYYQLLDGEPATTDLFEGIDTSWNRIAGSEKVQALLEKAVAEFQSAAPYKILLLLMKALTELQALPQSTWTVQKTIELQEIIRSCGGLWLEAMSNVDTVIPGQEIMVAAELINRSRIPFTIKKIILPAENKTIDIQKPLLENISFKQEFKMRITDIDYTHPYWLKEKPQKGTYTVTDYRLRGLPVAPYPINVQVVLEADRQEISLLTPVLFRQRDPVEGEIIRTLTVMPPVTVNFPESVLYFAEKSSRTIGLIVRSGPGAVHGELKLDIPSSWKTEPAVLPFSIDAPFTEQEIFVKIIPPLKDESGEITASAIVDGKTYNLSRITIEYPHLPLLVLHPRAESRFVRLDMRINRKSNHIGYIMGSGDDIPKYLTQVGYRVTMLEDEELRSGDLSVYHAVITGVRTYNTRDILNQVQPRLMDYMKNGGRFIVQYNTSRNLVIPQIGPFPFELTQNRVTEEDAAVTILMPQNPIFLKPNKIVPEDFNGWVQERGLYFADKWDTAYTPLLACHDTNEEPQKGGMLIARSGKGLYIYTGYAFFRQLPAGVPGALKLFVNMIDCSYADKRNK